MLSTLLRQTMRPLVPEAMRPWTVLRGGAAAFERKVEVDFTVRDYRVKTVDGPAELKQVLSLRRSVFHYEFAKKWISLRSDQDNFDAHADHLAIFDQKAGRVVGVYRLITSHTGGPFYSASEYDVSGFLQTPGVKLELSRACIDKDYRNGIVIGLLWKGLAEYAKNAGIDYLFGLSSVTTVDVAEIARLHRWFENQGIVDETYGITPRAKYAIDGFDSVLSATPDQDAAAADNVPSLLKTYLKAGAKVCSRPVIDRDFNCADWLTVLDMRTLASSFDRKYRKS